MNTLYQTDYQGWLARQKALLSSGRFAELDVEHLLEEMDGMGSSNRRELASHFIILIAHLLKWAYQPDYRGRSWKSSIIEQRVQIAEQLEDSPSLKNLLAESVDKAYPKAVRMAARETGMPASRFPEHCPYSIAQLLNDDFWPE